MAAKKTKYRLQVLLVLKERAKVAAERELARALKRLEEEKEKLKKLEEERRQLVDRIEREKIKMREKVAEGGRAVKDPQLHLNFLRKLEEDLEDLDKKIEDQKREIQDAENYVQRCRRDYVFAAQELNVMEKHKELWIKKMKNELSATENKLMNELGTVVHQMKGR